MTAPSNALPSPAFGYSAFVATNFEDLLNQHVQTGSSVEDDALLDLAFKHGRLLIQARAGAGKSTLLERLRRLAFERKLLVVSVDLSSLAAVPSNIEADEFAAMILASNGLSEQHIAASEGCLVTLDAVNEAPPGLADLPFAVADQWASRYPNTAVVVTDRLTRRRTASDPRWLLCGLRPVSVDRVAEVLGREPNRFEKDLLGLPLYLRLAASSSPRTARVEMFVGLLDHALEHSELERLSAVAYQSYGDGRRVIPVSLLLNDGQEIELDRLLSSEVLIGVAPGEFRFAHQLLHDYLATRHVASRPETWSDSTFDVLTLNAASADALVLLLDQVDPSEVDTLVRRVYDWNVYAAAYLLAEDARGERRVAPSTEGELLAMLAQRRFDPFVLTATRSADALRLIPVDLANRYLESESVTDVLEIAASTDINDDAYDKWLELFTTDDISLARRAIEEEDGIAGWTSANVLRRLVDADDEPWLSDLSLRGDRVVRWRAVHAMGALQGHGLDVLFHCLADAGEKMGNVRYGALRSIVEQAAQLDTAKSRLEVMTRLASYSDSVRNDPKLRSEVTNVLVLQTPPDAWLEACAPLLENLLAGAYDEQEHQAWLTLAAQVRRRSLVPAT